MLQMFKKLEINMNTTEKQKLKKKKKRPNGMFYHITYVDTMSGFPIF